MRERKVTPANSGASMGRERFNALEFFPDQPEEMGWWSKGVVHTGAGGG